MTEIKSKKVDRRKEIFGKLSGLKAGNQKGRSCQSYFSRR